MYRRRLRKRETEFGFDSFLDVIANVIGIIIRFILVAWVGARAYTGVMNPDLSLPVSDLPAAVRQLDHPLAAAIAGLRGEIELSKADLLQAMQQLRSEREQTAALELELTHIAHRQQDLRRQRAQLGDELRSLMQSVSLDWDEAAQLRQRSAALKHKIAEAAKQPAATVLRYRVPVSRPVVSEELMFECQGGRITFIDLDGFVRLLKRSVDDRVVEALKRSWQVSDATAPLGAFRMRYTVVRRRGLFDSLSAGGPPPDGNFSYGLARWELEPIAAQRGETLEEALQPGSRFRALLAGVLPEDTVVTMWVYPDSFALFRQLRDRLHEHGIEVAGRPLPFGIPIAASPEGTVSRAQ